MHWAKLMVVKMVHRHMKSDVIIHGFKSGPESDEKCWEMGGLACFKK